LTRFTVRIAALTLIAMPLAAFSAPAQAQPSVRIGDLDLASAAGQAAFAHRLNVAADQVCGDEKNLSIQYACKTGVRAEVSEKLAAIAPTSQFATAPAARGHASVRIADLDLASAAGQAAFAQRVNVAAGRVCNDERDLSVQHACRIAVRAEANEKLATIAVETKLAAR
jgi:UrcA family protein